jgi:hypothetical protein
MSKLVICLDQETFIAKVKAISKNEEGKWRYWNYWIDTNEPDTVKLIRHLGFYRFEPVPFRDIQIRVTEEDTKGFFGGEKTITNYYFRCGIYEQKIHPRVVHLEE